MIRSLFADRNMKSFRLRDFLDPKIKENLPKYEATLTKYIESYRNKNVDILSDIYILKNMIFTDNDKNILFTCCGVDEDELDKLIKDLEKPPFVQEQKNITPFRVVPLAGDVDRNSHVLHICRIPLRSSPSRGTWIEIPAAASLAPVKFVVPLAGDVDRNSGTQLC